MCVFWQRSVPRDAAGRSDFAMMAASPNRIAKGFTTEKMSGLVDMINDKTGRLLQVIAATTIAGSP